MIEIKFTPAQNQWLEVTWTEVTQAPDVVTPGKPAEVDEHGYVVVEATPETTTPGAITRTEVKFTSYHPTQLDLLQADAEAMGTPLDQYANMLADWVASYVPEPPPAPVIPEKVTMRQARLALLAAGKLAAVNTAINALPSPQKEAAQIEWEYSQEVQRHNGFVSLLAPTLGMDDEALDQLFVTAAEL
jgi:hypothetical protein